MLKKLLPLLLLAIAVPAIHAQVAPYAMFSASHYSGLGVGPGTTSTQSGGITPLGGTFGIGDNMYHAGPIALGADVRAMVQNSANSTQYGDKLFGVFTGGRIAANAIALPFRPYAQVEIGTVGQNNGTSTNRTFAFAYQFQFGGDFTIVPHVGVRVEYGTGQVINSPNHTLQTFGAGIVVRL